MNNTWNFYTERIGNNNDCDLADNINEVPSDLQTHWILDQSSEGTANELHLEGMGGLKQYFIAFYDSGGSTIITKTSSSAGRLNIEYPHWWHPLNGTAIVSFKVWRSNSSFYPDNIQENTFMVDVLSENAKESTLSDNVLTKVINDILLYPNPATEKIIIELPVEFAQNPCTLNIYNSIGELIQTYFLHQSYNEIDLADFSVGIYNFNILNSEKSIFKKVVINE